jgi:hypothetical protein
MTKRCFSSQQLYTLRNDIAVELLIEKTLSIPCRVTEGCFRFLCPLCNAFDTAVNPKKNLARCFRCEKNFNTIDLVILIRQTDFVQSVKFLQSIHQKDPVCQDRGDLGMISGSNPQGDSRMKLKTPSEKADSGPCRIGNILGSVLLPLKHDGIPEKRFAEYKPNKPVAAHQKADQRRIVKLEQQLEYLGRQIEKIAKTINVELPSK